MRSALAHGRAAFGRRAWGEAFKQLSTSDRETALALADLELLAVTAYLVGLDEESASAWTRAYHGYVEQHEPLRAARCAFWLGWGLFYKGQMAQCGGWFARAQRLVDEHEGECVERGLLLLVIPVPLAADLMQTAALRPGEHVVDVACGTGVIARMAAERVGPNGRVVGVDPNPGMLAVASSLPAPAGAAIEWRQGSAGALLLPDESFDFVLCQLGLMFVGDRAAGLKEMYRVLSAGGRVAINVPGPMPRLFEIFDDALARHIGPEVSRFVRLVFSLSDPDELDRLLRDAGFGERGVDVTTKTLRLPPPRSFLWQYVHSMPLGAVIANVDQATRDKLEADVADGWQPFVADDALVLDLPVFVATRQR